MGIAKGALRFLLELKTSTDKVHGKVLQLGRQHISIAPREMEKIAESFGVTIPRFKEKSLDDIAFFKALGFDEVESVDVSNYESCTFTHDLNQPIPKEYYGKYDFIYDGGTLEHVFHFPNCLANIHNLLTPGGTIVHCSPSHNHVDHGFYMFSPTVFHDYYMANHYRISKSNIFEYHIAHDRKKWSVYDYEPGVIDHLSFGGWGKRPLGIWFVAEKTHESTCGVCPTQSVYMGVHKSWESSQFTSSRPKSTFFKDKIRQFIKKRALVYRVAKPMQEFFYFKRFIKKHHWLYRVARGVKRLLCLQSPIDKKPRVVAEY